MRSSESVTFHERIGRFITNVIDGHWCTGWEDRDGDYSVALFRKVAGRNKKIRQETVRSKEEAKRLARRWLCR